MKTYPMKAHFRDEGGTTRVDVYDDIGEDPWFGGGISAAAFMDKLAGVRGPLDVHISSAGGMVDQGLAIYNALASYQGPVTTYNDGLAASVASVIMQAGSRRVMSPVSAMMIHDAWGDPGPGNAADMEAMRDALSKNSDIIARAYADRAGGSVQQWRERMQATSWYDADEALAAGLIDEIAGGSKPAAAVDLSAIAAGAPVRIMAKLRAAAADTGDGDGEACRTCDGRGRLKHPATGKNGMQCPSCKGSGTYDPDHDGDDDSTAEGDTDHDYVLPDGSPGPKALSEDRVRAIFREEFGPALREEVRAMAAASSGAAKVDNSPWDSAKAWHNGTSADDPEAFYRAICAGHHTSGDPKTQAYWALPYRYTPDSPPNAGGVRAAWGVLNGSMGGVQDLADRDAVEAKVQGLMKQVNPDWSPDDKADTSIFAANAAERYRAALKGARA